MFSSFHSIDKTGHVKIVAMAAILGCVVTLLCSAARPDQQTRVGVMRPSKTIAVTQRDVVFPLRRDRALGQLAGSTSPSHLIQLAFDRVPLPGGTDIPSQVFLADHRNQK